MSKQTEALKLALEALEETRNALAWFYDSYPQDVTKKGNELLPHVETVLTAIREALAEQPAPVAKPHEQQDYWQEEARRYAQNADFWRGKYESATAQQQEPVADVGLLEYKGNSVAYIHQKMKAYRNGIDAAWDAMRAKGVHPDGKTSLSDMIAKHISPQPSKPLPFNQEELYELDDSLKLAYKLGWRSAEAAHGITGEKK